MCCKNNKCFSICVVILGIIVFNFKEIEMLFNINNLEKSKQAEILNLFNSYVKDFKRKFEFFTGTIIEEDKYNDCMIEFSTGYNRCNSYFTIPSYYFKGKNELEILLVTEYDFSKFVEKYPEYELKKLLNSDKKVINIIRPKEKIFITI